MNKYVEGLATLVSEGLENLNRKELIKNLKECVKKLIEMENDPKKDILLYLIAHYFKGKAVIQINELKAAMRLYSDISIEHEIGKHTIEVILKENMEKKQ
jgi:hypothetical protein